MLKNLSNKHIIPVAFQMSILITLPLLVYQIGIYAIFSVLLGPIYHWLAVVVGGHMIISHNRDAGKVMNWVFYTLYFFTTFIPPGLWAAYHIQHHKHHDTKLDPQSVKHHGFKVLLATWDPKLADVRTFVSHRKKPMSFFYEKHYKKLIWIPVVAFLVLPTTPVLMLWAVPASIGLWLGTWAAYYTHHNGKPVEKFSWLNKFLLLGESELHVHHHKNDWNTNAKISNIFYD